MFQSLAISSIQEALSDPPCGVLVHFPCGCAIAFPLDADPEESIPIWCLWHNPYRPPSVDH